MDCVKKFDALCDYVMENKCIFVPYGNSYITAHFIYDIDDEYYVIDKWVEQRGIFKHEGRINYVPAHDEIKCEYSLSDLVECMVLFARDEL